MSDVQPLRLGMFVMPIHDPAKPLAQCIDEDLELAVQCDAFGFHDFWVGEHHSSSVENIVMPEIFLGKVLGLTDRIRVGPAPVCLQYHHPAHVAGRLAFLDHLSHGRLNVCFGPGAIPTDMEVFGSPSHETGERVAESIDMILRLWTGELPINIEGTFWNVKMKDKVNPRYGVGHLHKPFHRPHPPISVPSISRASVGLRKAAERGLRFKSGAGSSRSSSRRPTRSWSSSGATAKAAAASGAEGHDPSPSRPPSVRSPSPRLPRTAAGGSLDREHAGGGIQRLGRLGSM